MSFDDFLEQSKREKEELRQMEERKTHAQRIPWAQDVIQRAQYESRSLVSPNYIWFFEEKRKRSLGLINDLDIADIIAASKGVINGWTKRVTKNQPLFMGLFMKDRNVDWDLIMQLPV